MGNSENRAGGNRFDSIRIFVLIAGLILTGCQTSNQHILPENQDLEPMNDIVRISRELDKPKYAGIVSAIDFHPGDYPIRTSATHKRFSDNLLREYLDAFEKIGLLVRDKTVNPLMAYEELGFEVVKTWCNNDVQKYICDARKTDEPSATGKSSYSAFEEIARYCLAKDNKTCSDMDKVQLLQQE